MARGPAVLRIALQPPNEPLGVRLRLEEKELNHRGRGIDRRTGAQMHLFDNLPPNRVNLDHRLHPCCLPCVACVR